MRIYNELLASLKKAVSGMSVKTASTKQRENTNAVEVKSVKSDKASTSTSPKASQNTPPVKPNTVVKKQTDKTKGFDNSSPGDSGILNINIDMTAGATAAQKKEQDVFAASRRKAEQSLKDLAQQSTNEHQKNTNVDRTQTRSSNKLSPSVHRSKAIRTSKEKIKESNKPPKINLLTDIKRTDVSHINTHPSDKVQNMHKMESRNRDVVSHESQISTSSVHQPNVDFAHHENKWTEIQSANGPVRADHPTWMEHGHEISHMSVSHAPNQQVLTHSHAHGGNTQQGICKYHPSSIFFFTFYSLNGLTTST